jgi:hypothetical protein
LPPHVCRIFTTEDDLHRASVEDLINSDKRSSHSWGSPLVRLTMSGCRSQNRNDDNGQLDVLGIMAATVGQPPDSLTAYKLVRPPQQEIDPCQSPIIALNRFVRSNRRPNIPSSRRFGRRSKLRPNILYLRRRPSHAIRRWFRRSSRHSYHRPSRQPYRRPGHHSYHRPSHQPYRRPGHQLYRPNRLWLRRASTGRSW